jgi:hypothetical protein
MNALCIQNVVHSQIGNAWDETNGHGVDLRQSMVTPTLISIIERQVRNGRIEDKIIKAWLVLIEEPKTQVGYRIVASSEGETFGLASEGFPGDKHLVLCGWYGDFMTAFRGM